MNSLNSIPLKLSENLRYGFLKIPEETEVTEFAYICLILEANFEDNPKNETQELRRLQF